jgi:hypothetical protein
LKAQKAQNLPVYEIKVHGGFVVQNWLSDSFPKRDVMFLSQLSFDRQTLGQKYWHGAYHYPQIGASAFFGNLGNSRELGQVFGIVPSVTFNTSKTGVWNAKISLGIGLAYFNKPFDAVSNKENVLIGSHITNLSFAQLYFSKNISQKVDFTYGISAVHASNGHYQIPNVGLNAPSVFVGLKYFPQRIPIAYPEFVRETKPQNLRFNIKVGIGVHEFAETTKPTGTSKYAVYTGLFYLSKKFGKMSNVHLGVSGKYYNSYYQYYRRDSVFNSKLHLKSSVFSLLAGHEFLFGRFTFLTQACLDVYFPEYKPYTQMVGKEQHGFSFFVERWFSTRLGMQYYLKDTFENTRNNFFVGAYINANFGEADFIELGAGYVF